MVQAIRWLSFFVKLAEQRQAFRHPGALQRHCAVLADAVPIDERTCRTIKHGYKTAGRLHDAAGFKHKPADPDEVEGPSQNCIRVSGKHKRSADDEFIGKLSAWVSLPMFSTHSSFSFTDMGEAHVGPYVEDCTLSHIDMEVFKGPIWRMVVVKGPPPLPCSFGGV